MSNQTLCDVKYSYRSTPLEIQDESLQVLGVSPYTVSLKEKPSHDYPVTVTGYTEVTSIPTEEMVFYVDYDLSLLYFHSSRAREWILSSYHGIGSPIISDDVNRFSSLLVSLKPSLFSFRVEALIGSRVRLYGGKIIYGITIHTKKELFVDFGPNGNFEISPVTSGYFKAVLIGVLPGSNVIAKVEGVESHSYNGVKLPSFSSDFKPVAIIIVGSDMNILQKDIIPVINFAT